VYICIEIEQYHSRSVLCHLNALDFVSVMRGN
jgi:hypothetical protein